jgi:hypothetical protein
LGDLWEGGIMPVVSVRIERSTSHRLVSDRRRRRNRVLAAVAVATVASLAATGLAYATGSVRSTPSVYTAINPVKVLNHKVIHADRSARPVVAGAVNTAPNTATSVVLSVDVSGATTNGTLEVYPSGGTAEPSMRWRIGQRETQQLTVPVGLSGKITLKNLTGKVTVTVRLLGYDAPPDTPTTYLTSPPSTSFLWNSQYVFETGPNSYTEYFTRYDDVSVPALTQSRLDSGSLQVFMTPSPANNPSAWLPLPYQFDSSFGFTYNFTYVARPGHVVLMFYFIQTSPSATLPTLSTYSINTYNFKIVVTPNSAGTTSAARPLPLPKRRATCTPIPNGKTCTVTP